MAYEDNAVSTYPITDNNWRTVRFKHDEISESYTIEIVYRDLDTVRDVQIHLSPLEMTNIIRAVEGKIVPLEKRHST